MTLTSYLHFVLALIFVLGLIGGLAVVARRFGLGGVARPGAKRRLAVVEVLALDNRRRLVLIRRDQLEHLLLVGPNGEAVVESAITPPLGSFSRAVAAAAEDPAAGAAVDVTGGMRPCAG